MMIWTGLNWKHLQVTKETWLLHRTCFENGWLETTLYQTKCFKLVQIITAFAEEKIKVTNMKIYFLRKTIFLFPKCFQKASFSGLFNFLPNDNFTPLQKSGLCGKELIGWLVVLGFNATLTAMVISWRSVTHMFPGFLTPVLTQLFFSKATNYFSHMLLQRWVKILSWDYGC